MVDYLNSGENMNLREWKTRAEELGYKSVMERCNWEGSGSEGFDFLTFGIFARKEVSILPEDVSKNKFYILAESPDRSEETELTEENLLKNLRWLYGEDEIN
jgi:hypothetical protein